MFEFGILRSRCSIPVPAPSLFCFSNIRDLELSPGFADVTLCFVIAAHMSLQGPRTRQRTKAVGTGIAVTRADPFVPLSERF